MGTNNTIKGLDIGYHELADLRSFNKTKGLKFLNVNIGSYNKKESCFKLAIKKSKPDFINVCETWCTNKYDMSKIKLNGYNYLRQDRETKTSGGGLMVFYKKGYTVDDMKYAYLNCRCKKCELIVYEIRLTQTRPIVVISCYKPPHINTDILIEKLSNAIEKINCNVELYLFGDTNIDYLIKSGNRYAKLKQFENRFQLKQLITTVTRPKLKSNTVIDHVYSNSNECHTYGTLSFKPADHVATFAVRKRIKRKIETEICSGRRAKDFKEEDFILASNQQDWTTYNLSNDSNEMWNILKDKIIEILDEMCPVNVFERDKPVERWLNHDLLEKIERKDAAIKKAIRSKNQVSWDIANQLQRETRKLCNQARNDFIRDTLIKVEKNSRLFWKKVTPKINKKKAHLSMFDHAANNEIENKIMANKFNKFFSEVGSDLNNILPNISSHDLDRLKQRLPDNSKTTDDTFKFTKVTQENVDKLIDKMQIHKASGIKEISSYFLKKSLKCLSMQFTKLINKILETGVIPLEWKHGMITPIYKNTGKKDDPNNFRPISVLPATAKIMEKIINMQIRIFIERNKLYSNKQFGFRQKLSTKDAIEKVLEYIVTNQNNGRHVTATFVDLRKAFDVVNHNILLNKLKNNFNFHDSSLKLIKNYLENRNQTTKFNGQSSDQNSISIGVPQGSVLGPTLFGLYINELDTIFATSEVYLYADDTVILNSHPDIDSLVDGLNLDLEYYNHWLLYNRLTLNLGKTKFILFKGHGQQINSKMKNIKIGQGTISRCENYTYLGVVIDSRMAFDSHVKKVNKEISYRLNMFFRLRPCLNEKLATKIYKVMILPVVDYGDTFYLSGYQNVLNRINLLQNRAIRIIAKINRRDHVTPIRNRREIEDLEKRRLRHLLEISFHASLDPSNHKTIQRTTRYNHNKIILKTDKVNSDIYKRSYFYKSRIIWNGLGQNFHKCDNLIAFRALVQKNIDTLFNDSKNILINKKES